MPNSFQLEKIGVSQFFSNILLEYLDWSKAAGRMETIFRKRRDSHRTAKEMSIKNRKLQIFPSATHLAGPFCSSLNVNRVIYSIF